jgi:integrase/recombinase XerC
LKNRIPDNARYLHQWLDYLRFEKRYSAHTIEAYQNDLCGFLEFMDMQYGEISIPEIHFNHVRSWLAFLKEQSLTARSLNRKISALRTFFRYLLKSGLVKTNLLSKVISPKINKTLPVFIKEDELLQLTETLNRTSENWKSFNTRLLITLFYNTGLRLSELIHLKPEQIDFYKSVIKVLGKGKKERIIPVSPALLEQIKEYMDKKNSEFENAETEVLLVTEKGKKMYPKYAYLRVKEGLSGISALSKKSPHVLRHTFATHLMNHGADLSAVKELLGHSSLAATQVYTHNTIEKLKEVYRKAHPKA